MWTKAKGRNLAPNWVTQLRAQSIKAEATVPLSHLSKPIPQLSTKEVAVNEFSISTVILIVLINHRLSSK